MKIKALNLHAIALAAATFAAVALPSTASAGLYYDAFTQISGTGFGVLPKDLTLQAASNSTFESGAVGVDMSGLITFGSPIPDASVFMGNNITNASGTGDMPNPLDDNQKYGIPTIGSRGITFASDIGIVFNGTEPAGNSVEVRDLTLKFYTSDGTFLGAIDGSHTFNGSVAGVGSAGYVFRVDDIQQPTVDGWLLAGGTTTTMALEASINGVFGGPETFRIVNISPIPEPGTYALMLAGLGILGFVAKRRKIS